MEPHNVDMSVSALQQNIHLFWATLTYGIFDQTSECEFFYQYRVLIIDGGVGGGEKVFVQ